MYFHIGGDISLSDSWLLAVLDLDKATQGRGQAAEYLAAAEARAQVEWVGSEIPRTAVVCIDRVYLTAVSSQTLLKRLTERGQTDATKKECQNDESGKT